MSKQEPFDFASFQEEAIKGNSIVVYTQASP
jgi:hypothetical protein